MKLDNVVNRRKAKQADNEENKESVEKKSKNVEGKVVAKRIVERTVKENKRIMDE